MSVRTASATVGHYARTVYLFIRSDIQTILIPIVSNCMVDLGADLIIEADNIYRSDRIRMGLLSDYVHPSPRPCRILDLASSPSVLHIQPKSLSY